MRSSRLVIVGVSLVGLMLTPSAFVWTQQSPKATERIKELQSERLGILENALETANRLFQNARIEYGDLLSTQRDLLEARISAAQKQGDRIKACDEALNAAVETVALTQAQKESARGNQLAVLKAQAFVLEIKILREKLSNE